MGITLAEVFPPGEYLRDELRERGWTQQEFAEIIGKSFKQVNEVLSGRAALTASMAKAIAAALGTSAEVWLGLETAYRLSQAEPVSRDIARRARLRGEFPVRELQKRGWISASRDVGVLERAVLDFYQIAALDKQAVMAHAAKRTAYDAPLTRLQEAVLLRVRQLAPRVPASPYTEDKLRHCLVRLRSSMHDADAVLQVPRLLSEAGVRLVVCEALAGSKLDGVCTWLDDASPVIGMTLRLDRIDNFWFVLRHECEHILRGDGRESGFVVDDEVGAVLPPDTLEMERLANAAAESYLVPPGQLEQLLQRVGPRVAKTHVLELARAMGVHPGVVVGQVQRRLQRWDLFRPLLVKVRHLVTSEALTDGYGHVVA